MTGLMNLLVLWSFGLFIAVAANTLRAEEPYVIEYNDPLSESWRISRFPELNGLGTRCLQEDLNGNMWFGLRDGVVQYDGYEWTKFGTGQGLPGTDVFSLAVRSDGSMVAATSHGLFQQAGQKWKQVFPKDPLARFRFNRVIESSDHSMLACSPLGLVKIKQDTATLFTSSQYADLDEAKLFDEVVILGDGLFPTVRVYPGTGLFLSGETVVAVSDDSPALEAGLRCGDKITSVNGRSQNLVAGLKQTNGVPMKLEVLRNDTGQRDVVYFVTKKVSGRFHSPDICSVMEDRKGQIWVGVTAGGLMMSPDLGANWQTWQKREGLSIGNKPTALQSQDGNIWVFSSSRNSNVSRFDGIRWTNEELSVLGSNSLATSCVQTSDGTIWVGGLNKVYRNTGGEWFSEDTRDAKIPSEGHHMLVASDGALWIAGYDQSVVRVSVDPNEYVSLAKLKHHFTEPSGVEWFVDTKARRVVRREGDDVKSYGAEDGLIEYPTALIANAAGQMVAVGGDGDVAAISIFDGTKWKQQLFPKVARVFSGRGFCLARDGRLWIGARGSRTKEQVGGVVVISGDQWKHHEPPGAPVLCTSINELNDGRLVFGGSFGVKIFGRDGWVSVDKELLGGSACPGGTVTEDGTLWMTTRTRGLLRYKDNQWSVLDEKDGLLANEASAINVDQEGRLWISTRDGVCRFDGQHFDRINLPDTFGRNTIRFGSGKKIWLDGALCFSPNMDVPKVTLNSQVLTVDSNSDAVVSWSGIDKWNRTPVDKLKWRWRVDGGEWSASSDRTYTSLENLSIGKHEFEVRAIDGDANSSTFVNSMTITVLAPVWLRPWFLAIAVMVFGLIAWQSSNLVHRGIELKKSNDKLTSAREQLAQKFAEKSAQFRAVCDCSPIGIFVANTNNEITYFNHYLEIASGVSKDSKTQAQWTNAVHPDDQKRVRHAWSEAVRNREQFRCSGRFKHADKTIRWFEVVADRVERDGEFLGYVGALEDVTEKLIAAEELNASNVQLQGALDQLQLAQEQAIKQARLKALGQMAAGVVHDINNALTPLMTYTQMLEQQAGLTGEPKEWLKLICMGVRDTSGTVKRLEHFYRETHNRQFLKIVDVAGIAAQAVELTRPRWQADARASRKQVEVRVDVLSSPIIKGDASQLRSVLTNLIFNSVDAIESHGEVIVRVDRIGEEAVVEVTDSGMGMNAEQLNHCTEPFYTSKESGSGLGLSECHGIVRQHGGRLEVESKPGTGTTVRFRIPCEADTLVVQATQSDERLVQNPQLIKSSPISSPKSDSRRVLCIDDDASILASTKAVLNSLGFHVTTAQDGPTGLSLMETEHFDLVLCDQGLPGMDGLAVLKAIKLRWEIPVIMISGWTLPTLEEGFEPDGFIEKPYNLEKLIELVETHLCTVKVN